MTRGFVVWLALLLLVSPAAAEDELVMSFGGDVAYPDGRAFVKKVDAKRAALFRSIAPLLEASDANFVNLECPLSVRAEPPATAMRAKWVYRCHPKRLGYLLDAGFNLFSLANNHALDQGMLGVRETLLAFRHVDRDQTPFGLGLHSTPVTRVLPLRLARGKAEVAIFAVAEAAPKRGPVTSIDHPDLRPAIRRARRRGGIVVVSVHGGNEYVHLPSQAVVDRYRQLVDAGAHLVVGHHPHVIQGVERHGDGVILYSLGNLSFSTFGTRHREQGARLYGLLARVVVGQAALREVELVPLWVDDTAAWRVGGLVLDPRPAEPQLLGGVFAERVLGELDRFSRALPKVKSRLVRVGSRSFLDLGDGRGVPTGAEARRRVEAQKRVYEAVLKRGEGPRPARDEERFDTQDDRPAVLRNRYIP